VRRKKIDSFSLVGILKGSRPPAFPRRHVDLTDFAAPPMAGNFASIKPGRRKSPALAAAKSAKSSYRLLRKSRRAVSRKAVREKELLFFLVLRTIGDLRGLEEVDDDSFLYQGSAEGGGFAPLLYRDFSAGILAGAAFFPGRRVCVFTV
jgi:hypothetical protein